MDISNMTIDDIRQQVEEQIDFDRLEELNAQLEKDIRGILDSCGLYYRIFSRVNVSVQHFVKLIVCILKCAVPSFEQSGP